MSDPIIVTAQFDPNPAGTMLPCCWQDKKGADG